MHAALRTVTDAEIQTATRVILERWAHAVDEKTSDLSVQQLRVMVTGLFARLRVPGPYYYTPKVAAPLPWRLTPDAFKVVDQRIRNLVFPHGQETVVKLGVLIV